MKFCSLCEPKWFHNVNATKNCSVVPSKEGLHCSLCNLFACKKCIMNAIQLIDNSRTIVPSTLILSSKKWYEDTTKYLTIHNVPQDFVGHCCIIKKDLGAIPGASGSSHNTLTSIHDTKDTKLGGALFFPEYKVLIDSPKDAIDVHALGKESSFPAVWHCVLPPYGEYNLPRNIMTFCKPLRKHIKIPNLYSVDFGDSIQIEVCLYVVPRVTEQNISRKGSNDVSCEEIAGSMFVNDKSYLYRKRKSQMHVLLIAGNDGPLLLCRFLDYKCNMSAKEQSSLFEYLYNFLQHNATERMRFGGSSGNFDSAIMSSIRRLLSCRTNAPRRSRGVIWLLSDLKIDMVYLSPKSHVFVSHKYSLPVKGGNFSINEDQMHYMLRTYKGIADFMLRKMDTAYILDKINNESEFQIAPEAMNEELDRVCKARNEMLDCISNTTFRSVGIRKNVLCQKYTKYVSFTIITHPVGFHQDKFSQNKSSYNGLENKVVFSHLKQSGVGRGGLGDTFAWALLDWPK